MNENRTRNGWSVKFQRAFRGLRVGGRGQDSFFVHIPVACFVLAAAAQLHVSTLEWCVLVLCIAVVLSAELFNTAIEHMAKSITTDFNPHIRDSLDIASAAVLVSSLGAAVVGALILVLRIGYELGWWSLTVIN